MPSVRPKGPCAFAPSTNSDQTAATANAHSPAGSGKFFVAKTDTVPVSGHPGSHRLHPLVSPGTAERPSSPGLVPSNLLAQQSGTAEHKPLVIQDFYTRGGVGRDFQKLISIHMNKFYFRHATFTDTANKPSDVRRTGRGQNSVTDASDATRYHPCCRYAVSIASLVVIDRVATSKFNQLLYAYTNHGPDHSFAFNSEAPVFRTVVVGWPGPSGTDRQRRTVGAKSLIASADVKGTGRTESPTNSVDGEPTSDHCSGCGLELEVKVSFQPLRINLDQNTLTFMTDFQTAFSQFQSQTDASSAQSSGIPVEGRNSPQMSSVAVHSSSPGRSSPVHSLRSHDSSSSITKYDSEEALAPVVPIFIRKLTFYPDLPIRLDYNGGHFDLGAVSLSLLKQLNNAELVLPRRIYQRGYHSVDRLVEEIVDDLRAVLVAQLPRVIATSVGPMHDVRQFATGIWDLVSQPVISFCQGADLSTVTSHHVRSASRRLGLGKQNKWIYSEPIRTTNNLRDGVSGLVHGFQRGTRSFSNSTLWAALQLSIQGVRTVQSVAETAYDLVTPGPALRSRQVRLRQPANLREGFDNAFSAVSRGVQMVSEDLSGAARLPDEVEVGYKGPVGMVGDVLRQIPPTIVTPIVAGCEATANLLGGFRNQICPAAKLEDEQKWKSTHGR